MILWRQENGDNDYDEEEEEEDKRREWPVESAVDLKQSGGLLFALLGMSFQCSPSLLPSTNEEWREQCKINANKKE